MINIEDDEVTCNSYVVFSQIKKENFIYVDRHGNWVVGEFDHDDKDDPNHYILGSDVGKAKGTLRSNPDEGQHLECPCKVTNI